MRKYLDKKKTELVSVHCNCCKKELLVENGILKEGCLEVNTSFGYFSNKDGQSHRFDLCEKCYDEMIAKFEIPVEDTELTEYL